MASTEQDLGSILTDHPTFLFNAPQIYLRHKAYKEMLLAFRGGCSGVQL